MKVGAIMVTLAELVKLNKAWDEDCFITVSDLSDNAASQKLRLKFALSLYGPREVAVFFDNFVGIR